MERVSISLDDRLLADFDGFIARRGYENRSEAIRDLLRQRLERDRLEAGESGQAVGCLSYVYNHHQRQLAQRLIQSQHDHHSAILSTVHVHLDHENCLEVVLMQGRTPEIRGFAEKAMAETGVRHGHLHLIAAEIERARHSHGGAAGRAGHSHAHPKS